MRTREPTPPTVYVIAGPNGAGKTTFASKFLPDFVQCREFLNADLIASGLAPFAPETQDLRAGRLLLERIRDLSEERANFGFETTLSGRTYVKLLGDMKAGGYCLVLFFLWLPTRKMAVERVRNRVILGGHNMAPADIRRRYGAGLRNFFSLNRSIFSAWWLYDASEMPPSVVAWTDSGRVVVQDQKVYARIERQARHPS